MANDHASIDVNGRRVSLQEITQGHIAGQSSAEENAFTFIREWCGEQAAFEIHTSGSTGSPKKIVVTRDQMIASARLTENALQLRKDFNALLCLDARYIAGRMMIVRAFVTGMNLFIIDPCADPFEKISPDQEIHFTALVPYQVVSILGSNHPQSLNKIQICLIGGAPLDDVTCEKLKVYASAIFQTYGMTETISHIALRRITGPDRNDHFHTLPGIGIETDERGCLVINAPYLREKVITNDIVEIFTKEEFVWRGRYDNVINSGGVKISPEILEAKIGKIFTRLDLNNRFFIHHQPDQLLGQRLVLVIESPLPDASTRKAFIETLLHTFSPYETPRAVYESSSFIHTDTDKINRQATLDASRLIQTVRG